jgi:polyvinyl alcohol dehydrogenase (cytochrome)
MRGIVAGLMLVTVTASARAQDGAALYTQHCAQCHDGGARAPSRDLLAALPQERIVTSLETGLMRVQGEALTAPQKRLVAAYLSVASSPVAPVAARCEGSNATSVAERDWSGWGVTLSNERYQRQPGLSAEQTPLLKLRWAFGFEGEAAAAANPTIVGNRVFVGSASGRVYSIGLKDGCSAWTFKADAGVRASVVIGQAPGDSRLSAFVVDLRATLYRLDAETGELKWKKRLEEHRAARISGSPVLHGGRLFVPVSSGEEGIGAAPGYECCTFRGSLVAVDAASGEPVWQTFFVKERATPQTRNAKGTTMWGPSGAAVWASPTIDPKTRSIYVATGDSYSQPAAPMSDAVVAVDLDSGAIKWVNQVTAGDAYNMACTGADKTNSQGRPRSRLRPVGHPGDARRRTARPRRRSEVRRGPRLRSRQRRPQVVGAQDRPRRRARRHRMGIGERRGSALRAAVRLHLQGQSAAGTRRSRFERRRGLVRDSRRRRIGGLDVAQQRLRRPSLLQPGPRCASGDDSGNRVCRID